MDTTKYSPLGRMIHDLQGDMTETELCSRLNLSRNQLYNVKRGKTGTSPATIERIVQVFKLHHQRDINKLYNLAGFVPPESLTPLVVWLHNLRIARSMTEEDLAKSVNIDRQTIQALEAGTLSLDDEMLVRLIEVLQPDQEHTAQLPAEDRLRILAVKREAVYLSEEDVQAHITRHIGESASFSTSENSGSQMHVLGHSSQDLQACNTYLARISRDADAFSLVLRLLEYWADKVSKADQ